MPSDEAKLMDQIPLRFLAEYKRAWDAYESCCITGGTEEQRETAYAKASGMEHELGKKLDKARRAQERETRRGKAEAVR